MNTDDKIRRFLEGEKKLFEPKDETMFMLTLRIPQHVVVAFDKLIKEISVLVKDKKQSTVFKDGVSAVICGKPNVGKSSLFNCLLKKRRVSVTPVAGTTRDVVEAEFKMGNQKYRLFDTAGLGKTADKTGIQKIAVMKTREIINLRCEC